MGCLATHSSLGPPENGSVINNYVQSGLKMQGSLQRCCSDDWNISAPRRWRWWQR